VGASSGVVTGRYFGVEVSAVIFLFFVPVCHDWEVGASYGVVTGRYFGLEVIIIYIGNYF
jgi:hypothetical protein